MNATRRAAAFESLKADRFRYASTKEAAADLMARWAASPESAILEGWKPREGHVLTVTRAISARINQNFDAFPSEELRLAYKTFLGKPVFVNHHNDDPTRARGRVVGARYVEAGDDKFVEVIQEVNAVKYPLLAKELTEGGLDSVSMGCVAALTICSYCGNEATDIWDMCDHVLHSKGASLYRQAADGSMEKVLVYEECRKIGFFELSYVFDPADETAVMSNVLVASRKQAFGETEAPEKIDTLRDDDTEDGYHRYVTSPSELSDPDLDKAKDKDKKKDAMTNSVGRMSAAQRAASFEQYRNEGKWDDLLAHFKATGLEGVASPQVVIDFGRSQGWSQDVIDTFLDAGGWSDPSLSHMWASKRVTSAEWSQTGPDTWMLGSGTTDGSGVAHWVYDMGDGRFLWQRTEDGRVVAQGSGSSVEDAKQQSLTGTGKSAKTAAVSWVSVDDPLLGKGFATFDVTGAPPAGPQGQIVEMNDGRICWYVEDAYSGYEYGRGFATSTEDAKSAAEAALSAITAKTAGEYRDYNQPGTTVDWNTLIYQDNPDAQKDLGLVSPDGQYRDYNQPGTTVDWNTLIYQDDPDAQRALGITSAVPRANIAADTGIRAGSVHEEMKHRRSNRGPDMARTRRADSSRNDQGEKEDTFITQTPAPEPVETGNGGEITNTENNLVARRRAAYAGFRRYVASVNGNIRAASDTQIRRWATAYAKVAQIEIAALYPSLGHDLQAARIAMAKTAADDDEGPKGEKADDDAKAEAKGDDDKKKESARSRHADKPDFLKDKDDDEDDDKKDDDKKKESARRSAAHGRTADTSLEVAAPDGRVDVERPTSNTTDDEAQASQFDRSDFGDNAGDDIADPDLTTDQNWAPGDGKKTGQKMASAFQAVRLADAYIEAGLEDASNRAHLVAQFENITRATALDRTALLERVVEANRTRVASAPRSSGVRSAVPRNIAHVATAAPAPRVAGTDDSSAGDDYMALL